MSSDIVFAQRDLVSSLPPQCPATLWPQLLSTLGNASRLAGWLSFNLHDFTNAAYHYDDALELRDAKRAADYM